MTMPNPVGPPESAATANNPAVAGPPAADAPHLGDLVAHTYFDPYDPSEPGGAERTVYGMVVGVTTNTDDQGEERHTVALALIEHIAHGVPAAELSVVEDVTSPVPPAPAAPSQA